MNLIMIELVKTNLEGYRCNPSELPSIWESLISCTGNGATILKKIHDIILRGIKWNSTNIYCLCDG